MKRTSLTRLIFEDREIKKLFKRRAQTIRNKRVIRQSAQHCVPFVFFECARLLSIYSYLSPDPHGEYDSLQMQHTARDIESIHYLNPSVFHSGCYGKPRGNYLAKTSRSMLPLKARRVHEMWELCDLPWASLTTTGSAREFSSLTNHDGASCTCFPFTVVAGFISDRCFLPLLVAVTPYPVKFHVT